MGSTNENVWGAFPNFSWFIVISRRKISLHGANNNEHELTKNEKKNDFKTMSERTSAYTSECHISPKISRTLAYAGPIRYSVTGP